MVTIIPHPTEVLKLVRFQKELISLFYDNNMICYRQHPLWIPLPEGFTPNNKQELKDLSKRIENIKIKSPFFNDNSVFLPINFKINNSDFEFNFPILHLYDDRKKNGSKTIDSTILSLLPSCPVDKLKIFRLAIIEKTSEKSQAITDSVWIKL